MDNYSLPRRIWRIIYPVLMFIGIQLAVSVAAELSMTVALAVRELLRGASNLDTSFFADTIMEFIYENGTLIVLISNAISFAAFLPIWLAIHKRTERYENRNAAGLGFVVAGFFAGFNVVQLLVFGLTDITRFFPSYEEVSEMLSSGSVALQIITVGIAAPVVEEMVFRGILMNRMKWMPTGAAVIIQAVLFSVVHLNLFQSLYAFLAGILLGMVFIKFRSLIMVIIGHISFNLISVVLSEFISDSLVIFVFLFFPIIMVGCGAVLIRYPRAMLQSPGDHSPVAEVPGYGT